MDLKEVEKLLDLMKEHDLIEVELENPESGTRLRFRKAEPAGDSRPVLTAVPAAHGVAAAAAAAAPMAPPPEDKGNLTEVPSPMVGTYYRSPSPESDPFIEVGDRIGPESVVCIIEAMKVMNEIKAEVSGEVVEILVQNGEAVEYGQPVLLVRTS